MIAAAVAQTPDPSQVGPPPGAKVWAATDSARTGPGASLRPGQLGGAIYPKEALRCKEQGKTVAAATVGVDGRARRCWITQTSGSASLDAETCHMVLTQIRWTLAKDEAGLPIESQINIPVNWKLPR